MNIKEKVEVKLDKKGKNFLVSTPFHMNHIVQRAPNRKFMRSTKQWFLPGLNLNAKYLNNLEGAVFGDGVQELIRDILKRNKHKFIPFPARYKFKKDMPPRIKQLEALNHAWGKNGCLFDMEMGTGKTKIYVDLSCAMFLDGKIDSVVLLTKNSVCRNTIREIKKHCPLEEYHTRIPEFSTIKAKKDNTEFGRVEGMKFLVAGLESLSVKDGSGKMFDYIWDFVNNNKCVMIIDEVHLIKNPSSNRTKNVMKLGSMVDYRFAGTGTPITNNLLDLYAPYQFLDPNILGIGNFYSFRNRYTIRGGFENKEIVGYDNVDELISLIKPWTFQATKADMEDLPPKIYMEPMTIPMTKDQRKLYDTIRRDRVAEIEALQDKELAVQSILQVYLLLHQICAGFVSFDDDQGKRQKEWVIPPEKNPKYRELLSILEDNPQAQFNIWTKHLMELGAVYKILQKIGPTVKLHGNMSSEERERTIKDFTEGRAKYMIATQETGGTGLTFTNCSNVIYLSNGFKFGDRVQSEDRNHRIGTKKAVTYIDLVMENSVEEKILDILRDKKSLAEFVRKELKSSVELLKTH